MEGIKNYLSDMDGVILRGTTLIPGAAEFVQNLLANGIPFLILTNDSKYTQRDLQVRLSFMGLDVPSEAIFTSALATEYPQRFVEMAMRGRVDFDPDRDAWIGLR